jgi:hypothetical protein
MNQLPEDSIRRRARKVVDAGSVPLAHFMEAIDTNDKLQALIDKEAPVFPSFPEMPEPKEIDFTETNSLLQQLVDKEDKPIDVNITLQLV